MALHAFNRRSGDALHRPEFALTLGLLPPYTIEDIKRAYLEKVKQAHPDRGGDRSDFERIQHAFEQANEYLRFRSDRRHWIAARMEEYMAVSSLIESLRALGAEVETNMLDWIRNSFGDFADLTETITSVRLVNSAQVAAVVDTLIRERGNLPGLKRLALPGCAVTNLMALELRALKTLTSLDLSRTPITDRALTVVEFLPELTTLEIAGTGVGWWAKRRAERLLRKRRNSRPDPVFHPTNIP